MITNIIIFILGLSFIVFIHELGHLLAAKKFGVYCYEFAIGMGPKIYSFTYKETVYSIRGIPLGGYVMMAGEDDKTEELNRQFGVENLPFERTIKGVSAWKRAIIFLAGVTFNFILAILIFVATILNQGSYRIPAPARISDVVAGGPAAQAGLQANDQIKSIRFENGYVVNNPKNIDEVVIFIANYGGKMDVTVDRYGEISIHSVDSIEQDGRHYIGIILPESEIVQVNLLNVWKFSIDRFASMFMMMLSSVLALFKGIGLEQVSGPVGIYKVSSEVAKEGFSSYMQFIALISINIGLLNLLPIPALDGGRVVLLLVDKVSGGRLNKKFESWLIIGSMMLLLALMLFMTFKDVLNLF